MTLQDVLHTTYELVVDIALMEVTERGTCDHLLMAVVESEFNPPEMYKFDLLDPRLHLYAMQNAAREQPLIFGFVFVTMGTVLLPLNTGEMTVHPALLTVWCTPQQTVAEARLVTSDPIRGRQISHPEPAPDAVVEHYRKVFTGEQLPPSYYPLS